MGALSVVHPSGRADVPFLCLAQARIYRQENHLNPIEILPIIYYNIIMEAMIWNIKK